MLRSEHLNTIQILILSTSVMDPFIIFYYLYVSIPFKSLIMCEYNQNCLIIIPNAFRTVKFRTVVCM